MGEKGKANKNINSSSDTADENVILNVAISCSEIPC